MTNGITYRVQDGSITELADFARVCARSFQPYAHMRDDAMDAPARYPVVNDYLVERVAEMREKLAYYKAMTLDEAQALRTAEEQLAIVRHRESMRNKREYRDRYSRMLEKVTAWSPPTPAHNDLRKFMIEQLHESIKFDCEEYELELGVRGSVSTQTWLGMHIEWLESDLRAAENNLADAEARVANAIVWIQDLEANLAGLR